jgi:ABC-2 type transport system ATP-binding protein
MFDDESDQLGGARMAVVEVSHLTYAYGKVVALRDLDLSVPQGALYALLGPNGSGKTTLLQILMGLRRTHAGRASVFGVDSSALTIRERGMIGYIAEGQPLPGWMRLEELEAYLAPLYATWDASLARDLRERFALDPKRRIQTLSRGENMKAALLCALAPRPRVLLMDEPFTGMDALVKDELVRGLLESAGTEGWTVLLSSHDIGELELLADWVGFLERGRMELSESMDTLRQRFKHIEVVLDENRPSLESARDDDWMSVEASGRRLSFLVSDASDDLVGRVLTPRFPGAMRIDVRDATLREVFIALAKRSRSNAGVAA